jgi:hypothetical protein
VRAEEIERRASPRVSGPIPAVALDITGSAPELGTSLSLDNLSAGGFYARLSSLFQENQKLFLVTQISQAVIVVRAAVLRIDNQIDGRYGHAFAIEQHQIFSLGDAQPIVSCPDDTIN